MDNNRTVPKVEPIDEILIPFRNVKNDLLPALHAIDSRYRAIPAEAVIKLSQALDIPVSQVFGVVTFYNKFIIGKRGNNVIRICESAPCHVAGAAEIVAAIEDYLGIKVGETTGDGKFTIEYTQCVGRCHNAPVITINEQLFYDVTADKIPELLGQF